MVFHLREGLSDLSICKHAKNFDLEIEPLSGFCANGRDYNGLLLGYCGFLQEELCVAVGKLKLVLEDCGT